MTGLYVRVYLTCQGTAQLFSKVVEPFCFLTTMDASSSCCIPSIALDIVRVFVVVLILGILIDLWWYLTVDLFCISLITNAGE